MQVILGAVSLVKDDYLSTEENKAKLELIEKKGIEAGELIQEIRKM